MNVTFETVMWCERQLNDFVETMARNHSMSLTIRPFEPTASEQYIYKVLKDQLESVRAEYLEYQARTYRSPHNSE